MQSTAGAPVASFPCLKKIIALCAVPLVIASETKGNKKGETSRSSRGAEVVRVQEVRGEGHGLRGGRAGVTWTGASKRQARKSFFFEEKRRKGEEKLKKRKNFLFVIFWQKKKENKTISAKKTKNEERTACAFAVGNHG